MNKIALITGGAGFIGSHLAERLIREGFKVLAFDNLTTGSRSNLSRVMGHPNFEFIFGDITNEEQLSRLVKKSDIVFHLAAAVGVKLIVDDPVTSMMTNIRGTEIILNLALKWNTKILLASTSEVYGKNSKAPFSEDDDLVFGNTMKTRWSYACSKAIDEYLAIAHHRENDLPATIVRFFNTVGSRQSDQYGMVLPTFVNQALRGDPITVHGSGDQRRTFTHVSDTVDATFRLSLNEKAIGEVFNIGGSIEISMMELAETVRDRLNSNSVIKTIPYEMAFGNNGFEDMQRRVPDCRKIDKLIGYKPKYTIENMIDTVADFYEPVMPSVAIG